jgi:VWFA-related protein
MKVLAAASLLLLLAPQQAPRQTIRSGVELLVVDVQVVDDRGEPVLTLQAGDFEVKLDRRPRRVISAQLVRHASPPAAAPGVSSPAPPPATGSPAVAVEERRFILAIDEHSFRPASARAAMHAANRFIDQLEPTDLVGVYAYPTGAVHTDLTSDHAAVRRAIATITGLMEVPAFQYNISRSEAVDIASGVRDTRERVVQRECGPRPSPTCARSIVQDSTSYAGYLEMAVSQSLAGLRHLFSGLKDLEGRKTLVIVSGGLFTSDSAVGRGRMGGDIGAVGRLAAETNANLYVLHMDTSFLDAFSERRGPSQTMFRDGGQVATGLEVIAGAGGGALIRIEAGSGDPAFQRILRENAAYYLLGVEPAPEDRDGDAHLIEVRVRGRGLTVRSRRQVVIPKLPG